MEPMQSEEYAHRARKMTNRSRDFTSISDVESGIELEVIAEERIHDATLTVIEHSTSVEDAVNLLQMLGLTGSTT